MVILFWRINNWTARREPAENFENERTASAIFDLIYNQRLRPCLHSTILKKIYGNQNIQVS